MVVHVIKWDIHPDKVDAYRAWAAQTLLAITSESGLLEFHGYRAITGSSQVVVTFAFADLAAWSTWWNSDVVQRGTHERRALVLNEVSELWGPSPVAPTPVHPGA